MQAKRVLVVGGGSAGWTAAAYLNATLNNAGRRFADISLVESPDIPRIGVGEATIPNIRGTLAAIGIDETDFLKAVDGTFKQSIRFVNGWIPADGSITTRSAAYSSGQTDAGRRWLMSDRSVPFINTVSAQPIFCEMGLAPKTLANQDAGLSLDYAFHMDAQKFAHQLTAFSTARGVQHHLDRVVGVDMLDNGHIAAVTTASGKRLEADLFVDSTGFSAQLIGKQLGIGYADCSQWLLCDRAVTMNVPYEHHYPGSCPALHDGHGAVGRLGVGNPPADPPIPRLRLLERLHQRRCGGTRTASIRGRPLRAVGCTHRPVPSGAGASCSGPRIA